MSKEQFNAQANQIIMAYEAEKGKENGKEKNNNSRGVQGINNQRYDVGGIQQSASNGKSGSISRRRSGELQRGSNRRGLSRNGHDHRNGVLEATEELLKIKEVNATSFFIALSEAKKKKFTYDKCVTLHDLSEYEDMKYFLSASGKQGFAVTNDGDIVSVFNSNERLRGATKIMLPMAIKAGGKKLDCYNIKNGLLKIYSKFGFVPISRVPFDRKYNKDFPSKYGKPDVLIMAHNGNSVEQVKKKYGTYEIKDINDVPIEKDYDEAMKIRDEYLEAHQYGSNVKIVFRQ